MAGHKPFSDLAAQLSDEAKARIDAGRMNRKETDSRIERMARAGYARNVELTWRSAVTSPPTWDTTSEEVRDVWREIMRAASSTD